MPAISGKQYRLMAGVAAGNIPATGGLKPSVAKDFVKATPPKMRSQWAKKKKRDI